MSRRQWLLAILCACLAPILSTMPAAANTDGRGKHILQAASSASLSGIIITRQGLPLRGATVYLVHPRVGRSRPRFTDGLGRYRFPFVPPQTSPYYLEVYWGRRLIYRQRMILRSHTRLPPLIL